jgi:hypothetical protein
MIREGWILLRFHTKTVEEEYNKKVENDELKKMEAKPMVILKTFW